MWALKKDVLADVVILPTNASFSFTIETIFAMSSLQDIFYVDDYMDLFIYVYFAYDVG